MFQSPSSSGGARRSMSVSFIVLASLFVSVFVSASAAEAQGPYGVDVFFEHECPNGWYELGRPDWLPPEELVCRPGGFDPAPYDSAVCDEVAAGGLDALAPKVKDEIAFYLVPVNLGPDFPFEIVPYVCASGGYGPVVAGGCAQGTVEAYVPEFDARGCYWVLLSLRGVGEVAQPRCIEDTFDEAAADKLAIGDQFRSEDGVLYSISDCTLNCVDGFDANCDGKIGDFCAIEGRGTVAGAKACIEARDSDDSLVLPVSNLAAAATKAVPAKTIAVGETSTLAHTGSETSVLAFFGIGLLGFGAAAQGLRRRI